MTDMLQNPTTVTTTYLTISASPTGKPRKACLHVSRVQGGGNAALPTTVTIGGQVAAKQGGFPDGSFSRLVEAVYALTEAQIALMSGSTISLTGGNFGGQLLTAFVLDNVDQSVPSNQDYRHNPTAVTSGNIPLTRAAGSLTYYGILIPTLTTPTMSNPSVDGNQQGSGAQMTYGWQLEVSAGTSNCSYTSSSQLSGQIAINFPSPQPTIVSLAGITEDWEFYDEYVGLETVTSDMGEIVSATLEGRVANIAIAGPTSSLIDLPLRVDGMTWLPGLPNSATFTVEDAADNQASAEITVLMKENEVETVLADADITNEGTITYALNQLGYSVADGIKLYYDGTGRTIYSDGSIIATNLDEFSLWHVNGTTWNSFLVDLQVNGGGGDVTISFQYHKIDYDVISYNQITYPSITY